MNRIITYLTFNGNCREAMSFYRDCLGGELNFKTVGDSPKPNKLPKQMKKSILHATLQTENFILMATDLVDEELKIGNTISILFKCGSKKEMKRIYKKLSTGGAATHPIKATFGGALFGGLTDKYNNNWLLYFE